MRLRSLLFVPGDSERKLEKASDSDADALILDLEDAVAHTQKDAARKLVKEAMRSKQADQTLRFVRINPLDAGMLDEDLDAAIGPGLSTIVLPKAESADDVVDLSLALDRKEARAKLPMGSIKIMVVTAETPSSLFRLNSYSPRHPRLIAMTWGAEDLAASIGALSNRETGGEWTFPFQMARAHGLFAACGAGVLPIDTVYADYRDPIGLEQECEIARRDGFVGRLAIHPNQISIINRAFSPSEADIEHAQRVMQVFAENPGAGVVGIDGKMYDVPHMKLAQRTLATAGFFNADDGARPGFE